MMTARQRNTVLKRLYDYFNSAGRIMTEQEYKNSDGPVRYLAIKKSFRSYKSMVAMLEKRYPNWELAKEETPEVEEERPNPLEALSKKSEEPEETRDENE